MTDTIPTRPTHRPTAFVGGLACSSSRSRRSYRSGFTMVELLMVVGIMTLLTGLLVLGFRVMNKSARKNQTITTLSNLKSILEEYKLTGNAPTFDGTYAAPTGVFAEIDTRSTQVVAGSTAVTITRSIFKQLISPIAGRAIANGLPNDVRLSIASVAVATTSPWGPGFTYAFGQGVTDATIKYVCMSANDSTPQNQPVSVKTPWAVLSTDQWLLKDGWGSPILFVPRGGLTGVNGVANPVVSPDGKPFWVSAGPDGRFDTGSDNLYSFEN